MRQLLKYIMFALIFLLLSAQSSFGQEVSFTIKDEERQPLPGATIQLLKISDSTSVYDVTNKNGIATFNGLQNSLYNIKISFVGYQTLKRTIRFKPTERSFKFQLKENTETLEEVNIVAKKPLIRQEDDKMIIDPENIAHTSTNTLEVLESTPGLYVDQDNGIYLSSSTPAKVYINGREQKMSSQDISIILQSLPPGSVKQIEVMRTPSTKYDAASSGGIINIVLKKGVKIGRFGSMRAGMNQGVYGNRYVGFSINNSGDKTTTYLNANYNYNDRQEKLNTFRYLMTDTLLSQSALTRRKSDQFYTGFGISYDPMEKMNISYDSRINFSLPNTNTSNLNFTETAEFMRLSENDNQIDNNSQAFNIQQDLGLNYKLDTIGSELDIKLSYNFNNNNNEQDYIYNFTLPQNLILMGSGDNLQKRQFVIFQADLTGKLPYKITAETGIKSSFQYYESNSDYYFNIGDISINDSLRTNAFNYTERINAAYFQASKTFAYDLILKAGVRAEHTYMSGDQSIPSDTSFLINRLDFFPYVYLSRGLFQIANFDLRAYLIYRKTINRPDYHMLNPYINYVDQFMYEAGNPSLKPQFSDNVEFNVSFDDFPVLAIGRNYTTDLFSEVIYESEMNNDVIVRTYDNLGKNKETYIRGMAGIPPGGRYFFAIGGQYNLNEYDGYYQGIPLKYRRESWRFFTFHMLKLFGNTKLTVNGFLMLNGQFSFLELEDFGMLNFGIRQSFLKDRLNISFSARDVFKTMVVDFKINQGPVNTFGDRYTDNQRFGIKINYKFGITQKKDKGSKMFDFEDMDQ